MMKAGKMHAVRESTNIVHGVGSISVGSLEMMHFSARLRYFHHTLDL
jgi:hypothetical protein